VDAAARRANVIAGQAFACERSGARKTSGAEADGKAVWSWHPLLVSSRRRFCEPDRVSQNRQSVDDGDKTNSSPGRARNKPLKPLRAGMPGEPGGPVVTNSCVFHFAREAAGAAGTRHSPRPPWRRVVEAQLGRIASRDCVRISWIGWPFDAIDEWQCTPCAGTTTASLRLSNTHRDKFCNSNFSAVAANTCILPCRSALAVSSVMTAACGPATAMQLWPAASP
jgi:hypothetical protein